MAIQKTRLQVLASEVLKSKAGNEYQVLQCILHGHKLAVGTMRVYGDLAKETIQPGEYLAEFDLAVGFGDNKGEIVPRLVALEGFRNQPAPKPQQS